MYDARCSDARGILEAFEVCMESRSTASLISKRSSQYLEKTLQLSSRPANPLDEKTKLIILDTALAGSPGIFFELGELQMYNLVTMLNMLNEMTTTTPVLSEIYKPSDQDQLTKYSKFLAYEVSISHLMALKRAGIDVVKFHFDTCPWLLRL